ncbi:MAG: pyruvate dehydrogenase E2 component (dihydrolipoamide acetyltransferase) [Oceanicoccus sp.]|jgi:pyruvate dehydrogenase E2 component (dihydrolipoamide acetyltransferase)
MAHTQVSVPDLGGIDEVEVIEICVKVGDNLEAEEALIVLESDKATMEVPAPFSGTIQDILVSVGDKVSTDSHVANMETAEKTAPIKEEKQETAASKVDGPAPVPTQAPASKGASEPKEMDIIVPDLGGVDAVEIIELTAKAGDELAFEESLMVLESDKATMEIPAPYAGQLLSFSVSVGDKVSQGDVIGKMLVVATQEIKSEAVTSPTAASAELPSSSQPLAPVTTAVAAEISSGHIHAGPAVRKLARELGVDLTQVHGSGPRARIQKHDLHDFVKTRVNNPISSPTTIKGSSEDFSKFGAISEQPLSKIKQVTARNMVASWTTIPQVTQFDEADITELEAYRKQSMGALLPEGVKVSPLAFIVKACSKALKEFPQFNASLGPNADTLILKQYFNIGIAVDTPDGLLVPVIKGVDQKGVVELATNSVELAKKARDKKLPMDAMSGATFTISSLGGIGGTSFTPIVNAPQVAILGVSKAIIKPVWNGKEFEPRLMLPLSLSYDHRVIDGAQAARFARYLCDLLTDVRHLLL